MELGDSATGGGSPGRGDDRSPPPDRAEDTDCDDEEVEDRSEYLTDRYSSAFKAMSDQLANAQKLLRETDRLLMRPPKDRPPRPLTQLLQAPPPQGSKRGYTIVHGRKPPEPQQAGTCIGSPRRHPRFSEKRLPAAPGFLRGYTVLQDRKTPEPQQASRCMDLPPRFSKKRLLPAEKGLVRGDPKKMDLKGTASECLSSRMSTEEDKDEDEHDDDEAPPLKRFECDHPDEEQPGESRGAALLPIQLLGRSLYAKLSRPQQATSRVQLPSLPPGLPERLFPAGRTVIGPGSKMPLEKYVRAPIITPSAPQKAEEQEDNDGDVQPPMAFDYAESDRQK